MVTMELVFDQMSVHSVMVLLYLPYTEKWNGVLYLYTVLVL